MDREVLIVLSGTLWGSSGCEYQSSLLEPEVQCFLMLVNELGVLLKIALIARSSSLVVGISFESVSGGAADQN